MPTRISSSTATSEAAALLQRRLGLEPALDFLREAATFTLHWVSLREHQVAVELLQDRGRRGLSLVDCVSFAVMRHYGVTRAFAFDEDFEREGFALYRGHSA
ncbi:MAG: PIN domain-containing protein [Chloroflexi bacterium]|nr:PIN domain-containing protein [Chloroflexota bacterium]